MWRFKENEDFGCGRQHQKYEKRRKKIEAFLGAVNTV